MKRLIFVLSILMALSLMLAACGAPTADAPVAEAPAVEAPAEEVAVEEAPAEEVAVEEAPAEEVAVEEAPVDEAAAADGLEGTLKVWSFTNDTRIAATAFMEKHPNVNIEFVMIPMTNGEYQTKLKAASSTADAPDIVALEAAFVREWVESDLLADQSDLLPLAEELDVYPSVIEAGTYEGVTKAYDYEATPGAFFFRRSLAKECLGTDDLEEIQAMVADMDKFLETSAKIKECGTGDYYMVGTGAELANPFFTNRAEPWIVDDTLVIDPKVVEYIHFAKQMRDMGYESGAGQWSEGWFAGMNDTFKTADGTPKKVFSYFLPTWGLPYVLMNNAKSQDGASDTSGDWAMVNGPLPYQWGGTWFAALGNSENAELAQEFIRFTTLDEEFLTKWATGYYTNELLKSIDPTIPDDMQKPAGDFVSSQVVVEKITDTFDTGSVADFLGGQNPYGAFAAAAPNISARLMTGADDAIQRALNDPRDAFLNGTITEAEMWQTFIDNVGSEFPELILPEPPVTD